MAPLENKINASDNDAAIVKRVQSGDKTAFNLLVIRYQHKIIKVASKFARNEADATDIAQEAFIKAYRAIGTFRGESSFYTWLYRIAVNAAKTYLESNAKHQSDLDVDDEDFEVKAGSALTSGDTPDRVIESEELKKTILAALGQLPSDMKQALVLREVEGLSYEEISEKLGIPLGTVRSRIFRARAFVEEQMRKQ